MELFSKNGDCLAKLGGEEFSACTHFLSGGAGESNFLHPFYLSLEGTFGI